MLNKKKTDPGGGKIYAKSDFDAFNRIYIYIILKRLE